MFVFVQTEISCLKFWCGLGEQRGETFLPYESHMISQYFVHMLYLSPANKFGLQHFIFSLMYLDYLV